MIDGQGAAAFGASSSDDDRILEAELLIQARNIETEMEKVLGYGTMCSL